MSFNYLEIERAVEVANGELPAMVQGVELLECPLPGRLPDLNVGLRLSNKKIITLSLRSPWTGLFVTAPGSWRVLKQNWNSVFGRAQDWGPFIRGQRLERVRAVPQDRIVTFEFSNGTSIRVELFPSRPNWILTAGGVDYAWREALESKGQRPMLKVPVLREFEDCPGATWMERAFAHYLEARRETLFKMQLQRGQSQLQTRLSQLIKVRGQLNEALADSAKADLFRARGEELKGVLYAHPKEKHLARIELPSGSVLELDPKLSLSENANRLFSRYKKLQRTKKEVEARLEGIETETRKTTAAVAKLRTFKRDPEARFDGEYQRLLQTLTDAGLEEPRGAGTETKPKKSERKWMESGIRRFKSAEGLTLAVGRNHKENEELVIRMARGNDMWLHLKGLPGAHVIIQLPPGKSPSLETLLDGATLAAYYSGVQNSEKVEVDYTHRKYVRRVPGNADKFLVTYTQNKTLMVKLEETRLWRLLKQHSS